MGGTDGRGDPRAVDAGWLTTVLEAAGVAQGAAVTEVELVRFIGTGQMGRSARFALTWDDPDGRPASVVGKFPAEDPTARTTGFEAGSYLKEYVFYTQLAATVRVRTPQVWVARYDEVARDFVFIMEDLHASEQGDQMRGLSADEAALAVEQAVALHAPRWGDDSLAALLGASEVEGAERLQMIYAMTMEGTLARLGHTVSTEATELVRALAPLVARWALGSPTPRTLVHMDFRPDNFLFGTGPGAPPLAVVDWQTMTYGLGTHDLAYMVGGGMEPGARAALERDLVSEYCGRLHAAGVAYDNESCWSDYRLSSLWGVIMTVLATMLAQQTERGDEMFTTMLRRHCQHALDLDALDLLA